MAEKDKADNDVFIGVPEESENYKGLTNNGATCYMNSLLQAMFMTKEFRKALYEWKFDDSEQTKEDSIPYQLRKLFARLQLVDDAAATTDLIKSFGWNELQSFEQNDVQEFCRVLFEAINTTFEGTEQATLISDLYDGALIDRIHCCNCGNNSDKEVRFNDISLTIKDEFSNTFNDSLEKALAHYLGTERLEGDNQYQCSVCNQKADAEKGFKLIKLPKILCLNFNRFALDFQTFQRVKINDKVTFPLTLNMNVFLSDYQPSDIDKLINENPLAKVRARDLEIDKYDAHNDDNDKDKEEITNDTKKRFDEFMQTELKELEDQGEGDAEGQLQQKRRKQMKEQELEHQKNVKKLKKKINAGKSRFNRKNLNSNFFANNKKSQANEVKGWAFDFGVDESCVVTKKPDNLVALPGESEKLKEEKKKQREEKKQKTQENEGKDTSNTPASVVDRSEAKDDQPKDQEEASKKIERKTKKEWANIVTSENADLVTDYMKQGDFVYELYAILIHHGGAHAGHYYVYIKDFQNNEWYKFNDVMVHRISFLDIVSTFGQNPSKKRKFSSAVQNRANAYMLMYRQIDPDFNVNSVPISMIPQCIKDEIEEDVIVEKEQLREKERKDNQMQLKVIYNDESKTFWVNRKEDPLNYLLQQAIAEFELKDISIENCRLRAYNINNKVMQDTYTGKENESFEALKIFPLKTLALETKSDEESFEEYDPNQIILKVNPWRRGITVLREEILKPTRIRVSKECTMEELMHKLSREFNIPNEHLKVFKRKPISNVENVEELSIKKNIPRKLKILRINDGLNLFIENGSFEHPNIEEFSFLSKEKAFNKWETEFELDSNRFIINFNTPAEIEKEEENHHVETNIDYPHHVVMDKRMSVLELKAAISKTLEIGLDELIFKRSIHGTEIKEDDLSLKQASLYNNASLYIKRGVPSKENEKRIKFVLAEPVDATESESKEAPIADNLFYKIRELIEVPVNTHQTTIKVKKFVCSHLKDYQKQQNSSISNYAYDEVQKDSTGLCIMSDLSPEFIRLREYANGRLTKVYKDDTILEQYTMFEGKQIAIQILKEPDVFTSDSVLVMLRSWNPSTWELSPMREIVIPSRYSTLDSFSYIVHAQCPDIPRENVECCKIMTVQTFFRLQLPYESKWYELINNENFLAAAPFYLSTDGLLFIAKDKTLKERELTAEEKKAFGCDEFGSAIFAQTAPLGGKRGVGIKEKAMKIQVKKKKKGVTEEAQKAEEDFVVCSPEHAYKDVTMESTDVSVDSKASHGIENGKSNGCVSGSNGPAIASDE